MIINCSFSKILSQFAIIFRKIQPRTSTYGIPYSPKDKKFALLFQNFQYFIRSVKTKSRLKRCRFSQKTNKRICFVCFFAFQGKKTNSFVRFFGRISGAPNLLSISSDLQQLCFLFSFFFCTKYLLSFDKLAYWSLNHFVDILFV